LFKDLFILRSAAEIVRVGIFELGLVNDLVDDVIPALPVLENILLIHNSVVFVFKLVEEQARILVEFQLDGLMNIGVRFFVDRNGLKDQEAQFHIIQPPDPALVFILKISLQHVKVQIFCVEALYLEILLEKVSLKDVL